MEGEFSVSGRLCTQAVTVGTQSVKVLQIRRPARGDTLGKPKPIYRIGSDCTTLVNNAPMDMRAHG